MTCTPASRNSPPTEPVTVDRISVMLAAFRLRGKAPMPDEAQWIPRNAHVCIAGVRITGGLFYIGKPSTRRSRHDPGLVDTSLLAIREGNTREPGARDYTLLSPSSRLNYLSWLANNRGASNAPISFAFIYFFGLERRVTIDARESASAQQDVSEIAAELVRMLEVFGHCAELRSGMLSLLAWCYLRSPVGLYLGLHDFPRTSIQAERTLLQVVLGKYAQQRDPLPVAIALAWLRSVASDTVLKAAQRHAGYFNELFAAKYAQRHGRGMILVEGAPVALKAVYVPASEGIRGRWELSEDHTVPDTFSCSLCLGVLQDFASTVCTELQEYQDYVSKRRHSAALAVLRLPFSLWPAAIKADVQALHAGVVIAGGVAKHTASDVAFICGSPLSNSDWQAVARGLQCCGIGIEPDVLSGAKLRPSEPLVLFVSEQLESIDRANVGCTAALLVLTVAAAAGLLATDIDWIRAEMQQWEDITQAQRRWLLARAMFLAGLKSSLRGVREYAAGLPVQTRAEVTSRVLRLHQRVEQRCTRAHDVITRALAILSAGERNVASDPSAESCSSTRLDFSRIDVLRRESDRVGHFLAAVFADADAGAPPSAAAPATAPVVQRAFGAISGLDDAHYQFLRALIGKSEWHRPEVSTMAKSFGLLLDGAVTQINEASLEAVDEPLLRGIDVVCVDQHTLQEILR